MKYKIIFLIIFAFALVLRLSGITSNSGLSYDELFFWNIVANNDYTGIINTLIQTDYHPALYLILLKFWISIFGDSDISMQILSVGFSLLSVWIVYLIGKNLKNKQFGLILMAYFAFSYIFIAEAQTVRFYQMGQFLSLLSIFFSIKLIKKTFIKNYIYLAISNILLICTQTTGLIFIGIEAIILLYFHVKYFKNKIKTYLFTCLTSLIVLIPQLIMTSAQILNSRQTFWQNPWEWGAQGLGLACFLNNFTTVILSISIDFIPNWLYLIVVIAFFVLAYKKSISKNDYILNFLTTFLLFYSTTYYILQKFLLLNPGCNVNYLIFSQLLFFLTLFKLLSSLNKKVITAFIFLHLILTLNILSIDYFRHKHNKLTFGSIAGHISNKNYNNPLIFSLYGDNLIKKYNSNFRIYGLNADKLFTMKSWEGEFNKIFDIDFANMSQIQRESHIVEYLKSSKPSDKFVKLYKKQIQNLNKSEYFIVITPKKRLISQDIINKIVSDENILHLNSKSLLTVAKLNIDILKLAYLDSSFELVEKNLLYDNWYIFAFKKIN